MSIGYKIAKELSNTSFTYGGFEGEIGFIMDNYYEAMKIYRCIVKELNTANRIRRKAHEELKGIWDDEEKWKKNNKWPKNYDAAVYQKRKDHLMLVRQAEPEIMYNGAPLPINKLTNLIIKRMGTFEKLEFVDRHVRKKLGGVSFIVIKAALWPTIKMIKFTANNTTSLKTENMLRKNMMKIEKIPEMVKEKIANS